MPPLFKPKPGMHPLLCDLRMAAEDQKISLEALSAKSGYNVSTIKEWGKHSNPKLKQVEAVADVLGFSLQLVEKKK